MEMRKVYAETMAQLMRDNDKIVILDADLGKACGTLALYKEFPERCFDIGIAEDNMASVAAGFNSYGYIPFYHSFAPFAVRRAYDQLYVSVAYAKQKVVIVGTDPGVWAGVNGGTHMTFEDIAALRAMSQMVIYEPVDEMQLRQALPQIVACPNPVYIRLGRKETPNVFAEGYKFDLFKADVLREGKDISIVVTGINTIDCLKVADRLQGEGYSVELINAHTIKPLDYETIENSAKKTKRVLTVENSNKYGGLYGAVCEYLSAHCPTLCDCVAVEDMLGEVGSVNELKQAFGLTEENIYNHAKALLKR